VHPAVDLAAAGAGEPAGSATRSTTPSAVILIAGFAVPIGVGVWSDRRGRRLPFIVGGAALTVGGLVAVGLGNGTSYLALGLAAGLVYVGLNALTTAHRAIVAEDVEDGRRPAATSAQEVAGLIGAVVAVAIGGALIEPAPAAAFALAAVVLVASALPTMVVTRRLRLGERAASVARRTERANVREVLRRPGAREIFVAQALWVTRNYILLLAFTVIAAAIVLRRPRHVLGAALGVVLASYLAGAALEVVKLFIERARPEEVLGAQVELSHGRSWAHLASYRRGT
jgi:MFS family permease